MALHAKNSAYCLPFVHNSQWLFQLILKCKQDMQTFKLKENSAHRGLESNVFNVKNPDCVKFLCVKLLPTSKI